MSADTAAFAGPEDAAPDRRRAALVQGSEPSTGQRRLSLADVERLQADRSPDARAAFATHSGRHYDDLTEGETRPLADAVLDLLVRDVEVEVREALSEAIADQGRPRRPAPPKRCASSRISTRG